VGERAAQTGVVDVGRSPEVVALERIALPVDECSLSIAGARPISAR
jgi:hypothetical protein